MQDISSSWKKDVSMAISIYNRSVEMRNNPLQQSWREASWQGSPQGPGSAEGGEAAAKPAVSCGAESVILWATIFKIGVGDSG